LTNNIIVNILIRKKLSQKMSGPHRSKLRGRPSLRAQRITGLDGGQKQQRGRKLSDMDVSLGPWVYYWPTWFSTYGSSINDASQTDGGYFGGSSVTFGEEGLPPLPRQWIGKTLILKGQKPAEIIATGQITPTQANKYVFERSIRRPYIVLGSKQVAGDYIAGRLSIYLTSDGVIENVRYG
jgi:hypothetical protein